VSLAEAYTPTRHEQDAVVERIDEGIHGRGVLKAVFVSGSVGVEKTRIAKAMFPANELKGVNARIHLAATLKMARMPLRDSDNRHAKSTGARVVRSDELRHHAAFRRGMLIDCTDWAYNHVADACCKLKRLGYDCSMVCSSSSLIDDEQRGMERNRERYRALFGDKRFHAIKGEAGIVPKLRSIGREILRLPVANAVGQEWLEQDARRAKPLKAHERAANKKRLKQNGAGKPVTGLFMPHGEHGFKAVKL